MTPLDGEEAAGLATEIDLVAIPDDCIRFWPRSEAPMWVFELIGPVEGPSKGYVGYIPARLADRHAIPLKAAFPWGRIDETGDGGFVIQTPEFPVLLHGVL